MAITSSFLQSFHQFQASVSSKSISVFASKDLGRHQQRQEKVVWSVASNTKHDFMQCLLTLSITFKSCNWWMLGKHFVTLRIWDTYPWFISINNAHKWLVLRTFRRVLHCVLRLIHVLYIQLRPSLSNTLPETNIAPENRPSPPNPQISGAVLVLRSVKADEMLMIPSVITSIS